MDAARPGGRLLSTDGAPEMVDAAGGGPRSSASSNVEFAVDDAAVARPSPDASVDGMLCRLGLMLVPDMDATARQDLAACSVPAAAPRSPSGPIPTNDWMTATGRAAVELGLRSGRPRTPLGRSGLSADGGLEELLEGAGLRVETVEDVALTWRAASLDEWWGRPATCRVVTDLLASVTTTRSRALRAGAERRVVGYVAADGAVAVPSVARVALAVRSLIGRTRARRECRKSGEDLNRTGDSTVFSRVLYRLSYLASSAECSRVPVPEHQRRTPAAGGRPCQPGRPRRARQACARAPKEGARGGTMGSPARDTTGFEPCALPTELPRLECRV